MALVSHWATAYGQEGKTKIRIAIPSASICCLHLFAAQQWKVFEDNGLDVEIIQMRPQVANAAMVGRRNSLFRRRRPQFGRCHFTRDVFQGGLVCFRSTHLLLLARPEFKTLTGASLQAPRRGRLGRYD